MLEQEYLFRRMPDEDSSVAGVLDLLSEHNHNDLKVFRDEGTDLRGFIAVHDTTLGPAVGGTRRYAFDLEEEAIRDALRLSRAMTHKYAISDIDLGGAKGVIWTKSDDQRSEELYRSYGRAVDDLGGRFITGADVGTDEQALRWINKETDYVLGLPEQTETPARYHAGGLGVYRALEAACDLTYSTRELSDLHVAVQAVVQKSSQGMR
jgi:leucine dehydrogenase